MRVTNIRTYSYGKFLRNYQTIRLDNGKRLEMIDTTCNNQPFYSVRQLFDATGEWIRTNLWYGKRARGCRFFSHNDRYNEGNSNGKVLDKTI